MADGVSWRDNHKQVMARFAAIVPAARPELIAAALKSAEEIRDLAKRFVPVKTGALRDSIVAEDRPEQLGARVIAGNEDTEVRSGSGVGWNIARGIEFGVAPHTLGGKFKGAKHPGSKPQPFLFPAARFLRKRSKGRIGRAIGKAAKKVAAK